MTFAAPTPIRLVCNLPADVKARYDRSSMRRMVANAAPWSFALKEAYMADFGEDSLWEVYGSTELGVDTVLSPQDQRRKPGACGRPAPGVEIRLYDQQGEEVTAPGVPGEVYIRAVSNFTTYYKADERAAESRRGDFATVGDIAYRDQDGFLYICDRKNDMIISGGMNVYPAEVEAALELHPGVVEAAVFGIPDDQWGERVHAVVVPRDGHALSQDDLAAFARQRLASYKVPRSVSFVPQLPHTGSGKILKRELREPFWQGRTTRV
jgi:acyl-CoA synthetase (AMP-forming)/AMP-acid ligase II